MRRRAFFVAVGRPDPGADPLTRRRLSPALGASAAAALWWVRNPRTPITIEGIAHGPNEWRRVAFSDLRRRYRRTSHRLCTGSGGHSGTPVRAVAGVPR